MFSFSALLVCARTQLKGSGSGGGGVCRVRDTSEFVKQFDKLCVLILETVKTVGMSFGNTDWKSRQRRSKNVFSGARLVRDRFSNYVCFCTEYIFAYFFSPSGRFSPCQCSHPPKRVELTT